MKTLLSALVFTFAGVVSSCAFAQTPTDYATAYENSQVGEKPLLVLVTATWCPPCQVMKKTTIPALMQREAFRNFNYSTVDLDEEEVLAR